MTLDTVLREHARARAFSEVNRIAETFSGSLHKRGLLYAKTEEQITVKVALERIRLACIAELTESIYRDLCNDVATRAEQYLDMKEKVK